MDRSKDKDMTTSLLHGQTERQITTRVLHAQKRRQSHDHKSIACTEARTKT